MRPNIPPAQFVEWLRQLPLEERIKGNDIESARAKESYDNFVDLFGKGMCSLCGKSLKTFSLKAPCLHWFLRPKGLKKKMMAALFKEFSYFRISSYVRWVASIEGYAKNINDIKDEHEGDNVIDFTARYKHLTWSFYCSKSDFQGHPTTSAGKNPHYHMQIQLGGESFIRYSEFHVEFHSSDLYDMELFNNYPDIVKHTYGYGEGMNIFFEDDEIVEKVALDSVPTENVDEATFNIQSILIAEDGKTISGEKVHEAIVEAKSTGKTVASVLREKITDANIMTIVSPGPGVPQAMQRTKTKR